MWADAQCDGRTRNVGGARNFFPCTMPHSVAEATARLPCSNAANIERKTWTQSEFCTCQNSVTGQEPPKCIYNVAAQQTAKHRPKFG